MGRAGDGLREVGERAETAGGVEAVQELVAGMSFAERLAGHHLLRLAVAADDVERLAVDDIGDAGQVVDDIFQKVKPFLYV